MALAGCSGPSGHTPSRRAGKPLLLLLAGIVLLAGFDVACALMLWQGRKDAWDHARVSANNLAFVLDRDIARTLDISDFALQTVRDGWQRAGDGVIGTELRRLLASNQLLDAGYLGSMLILGPDGRPVQSFGQDVLSDQARLRNIFAMIRDGAPAYAPGDTQGRLHGRLHGRLYEGPFIDVVPRPGGSAAGGGYLVLGRPLHRQDGGFAGVILSSLSLDHVQDLFAGLALGQGGRITLFRNDGLVVMTQPYNTGAIGTDARGDQLFRQVALQLPAERRGLVVGRPVDRLPLTIGIALSNKDVLLSWKRRAIGMGALMLSLSLGTLALAVLTVREWRRRRAAENAIAAASAELAQLNRGLETRVADAVAAREASQNQLIQSHRMEALGQLAGGIAHDFNNVLQSVCGAAQLILVRPDDAAEVARLANMVLDVSHRGTAITRRLLVFARRGELRAEPVPPRELLEDLREIMAHTFSKAITIRVEAAADLPPVLADRAQLETVLVNLAVNARDAMPGGGQIVLSAELDRASRLAPLAAIRFTVADSGTGMDQDTLARVGEAFFTTKPEGQGTGLGLSMARNFAEQSHGDFTIDSTPGRGTSAHLWLQALPDTAAARDREISSRPDAAAPPSCHRDAARSPLAGRHIMLVDDEALIRDMLEEELHRRGCHVQQAGDAAKALAAIDAGAALDLLITDLTMPGMDGIALIQQARQRRGDLPVLILTGHAGDGAELAVSAAINGHYDVIEKPVEPAALALRAAAMLEGERSCPA